ncbi:MAG TPA: TonB family protein [Terracidiphilus sp.]|nr:TonB family protein [Terracidiphilus sp.]
MAVLVLSLAVHLAVSTIAWIGASLHRRQAEVAQTPMRFYPAALFLPGGVHVKPGKQPAGRIKHAQIKERTSTDLAMSEKAAAPAGHPVAADHAPMPGNGADAASADPAYPIFSPRPEVTDRSLLPSTDRQVIVDVKVSAKGDVLEASLVQGIGNALDSLVLATVKTWRFHPAMINGSPVPTEAELIFPFSERTMTSPS